MIDNLNSKEEKCCFLLYLNDIPGIGPGTIKKLFDEFKSFQEVVYYIENNNLNSKWFIDLKKAIESLTNDSLDKYKRIIENTYKFGGNFCTIDENIYPANLKKSSTAPSVLFYKGSLKEISERALAIVGTVDPSDNGIKRAQKFARLCVENNIQVVSGLARGIDTVSQSTALKYGGKTFSVVAYGIDYCYPPENKKLFDQIANNGAIITQFPTGTKPMKWMFPARNETMCTLSLGTVIIEAHEKCGSLIQARYSFKHQRRVFLLNSNIERNEIWPQKLIDEGAVTVKDFKQDILKNLSSIDKPFQDTYDGKQIEMQPSETKKVYLFDLDGVLYDSTKVMKNVYAMIVQKIKGSISEDDKIIISEKFNNAPKYVFKCLHIDPEKGNEMYRYIYFDYIKKDIKFFPKINKVVAELKRRKNIIGIVTSQPLSRYKSIIQNAEFKDIIDVVVTWNDVPKGKSKPDPYGILKALETVSALPHNSVYIGDDPKDIIAAKKAGTFSIAALWGSANPDELMKYNADFNASSPEEILSYNF